MIRRLLAFAFSFFVSVSVISAPLKNGASQKYFENEVARIEADSFAGIESRENWEETRGKLRAQLFEMLGVDPARARTDLRAVVTGMVEREGIVVEKVHFQSMP